MEFDPVLRFVVCSDVHVKTDCDTEPERFLRGMAQAYGYAAGQKYDKLDALYVVGDFANRGTAEEMQRFQQLLRTSVQPGTEVVLTMASHEFMCPDPEDLFPRFRALFGMEPDNHRVINGFHFISLTTDRRNHVSEEQKAWLQQQLRAAADEDWQKPIFVFQHPHLSGTVYGSINWGEDDIIPILMDYPQVVDFSGHSHAPVNDPRSVYQEYFSCFGTGSLSYFELDEFDKVYGTVPPDAGQCAQYLIVEADACNRVRVLPFDILSGCFFNDGWLIERPWDPSSFLYTADRALKAEKPAFPAGAEASCRYSEGKLTLTFPQAEGKERPDSYTAVIRNAAGRILAQRSVFSSYYLYHMPQTVTMELEARLAPGEYRAELTAKGFWNNRSAVLAAPFTVEEAEE